MSAKHHLTIVIPAYNEEKIIKNTLEKVLGFLSTKNYFWDIIVVDDGSKDSTSNMVKKLNKKKVSLIKLPYNKGKGAALKEGFLAAKGDYVIFTDADLSVPIENVDTILSKLEEGADVAIASRRTKGSKILVHQPWVRESMGRVFTLLTKLVTSTDISDFTCGFKGFDKKAAKEIFGRSIVNGWSYDAEILFLANKLGFKIVEVPVVWKNRIESRVELGKDVLKSFTDLLLIRLNDLSGKYEK